MGGEDLPQSAVEMDRDDGSNDAGEQGASGGDEQIHPDGDEAAPGPSTADPPPCAVLSLSQPRWLSFDGELCLPSFLATKCDLSMVEELHLAPGMTEQTEAEYLRQFRGLMLQLPALKKFKWASVTRNARMYHNRFNSLAPSVTSLHLDLTRMEAAIEDFVPDYLLKAFRTLPQACAIKDLTITVFAPWMAHLKTTEERAPTLDKLEDIFIARGIERVHWVTVFWDAQPQKPAGKETEKHATRADAHLHVDLAAAMPRLHERGRLTTAMVDWKMADGKDTGRYGARDISRTIPFPPQKWPPA